MNNLHAAIHEAVSTDISRLVAVQRSSTRSGDNWDHKTRYEFIDGAQVELSARFSDVIVFPAVAGFELLTIERTPKALPVESEMAGQVSAEPILAWSVLYEHGQGYVEAITTFGSDSLSWTRTFKAIRLPSGSIQWHAPFDQPACSVFDEEVGRDEHRRRPIVLTSMQSWLDLVSRVWLAQADDERESATPSCPNCGNHIAAVDGFPF